MQALIPNKDILFTLTSFQKEFLLETNAFPFYPLWAFTELPLMEMDFVSCTISAPQNDGNEYYFPVEIKYKSEQKDSNGNTTMTSDGINSAELKIIFSLQNTEGQKKSAAQKNIFPVNQRVFRTAEISRDTNSWKIIAECWKKLTN